MLTPLGLYVQLVAEPAEGTREAAEALFNGSFELTDGVDGIEYYGKGPHENYCDRKTSARLGVYRFQSAESFIHDYLFPQENANRCDVRWLKVGNERGVTVSAADGTPPPSP